MNYYSIPKQVIDAYIQACEEREWELFCLFDTYHNEYLNRIASVDSDLQHIDLTSQNAQQGLAALLEYYVRMAKQRGLKHIVEQIQWALTMSRIEVSIGSNNDYHKLYDQQRIVYSVESIMHKNNTWYDDSKCYRIIKGETPLLAKSSKLSKAIVLLNVGDFVIGTNEKRTQVLTDKIVNIKVIWHDIFGWVDYNSLKEAGS